MSILTVAGQTLWDLAVQLYGDASMVFQILADNPALLNLDAYLPAGTAIVFSPTASTPSPAIQGYFAKNRLYPNTGETAQGLQAQGIGFDAIGSGQIG